MEQALIAIFSAFAGGFGVWFFTRTLGRRGKQFKTEEALKEMGIDANSHIPLRQQLELWKRSTPEIVTSVVSRHQVFGFDSKALVSRIEELEKMQGLPAWMIDLGKKITGSIDVDDIFRNLTITLQSLMDARLTLLGVMQTRSGDFEWHCSAVNHSASLEDIGRRAYQGKEMVVIQDAETEYTKFQYVPLMLDEINPAGSVLATSLEVEGRLVGVLVLASPKKNSYTLEHQMALNLLTGFMAVALDNAQVYRRLKETQDQLIRQEKLASLGMLTAGIAHELQNPLNFVNNISKTGKMLVEELEESTKNAESENSWHEIMGDLKQSLEKIGQHGERASRIIVNMLDQSRQSDGTKVATDINHLVKEYAELAIQSIRGQKPGFNCHLDANLDQEIGKKMVYPQELARVLINLYNNALYAMEKRSNKQPHLNYSPQLKIGTQAKENHFVIEVEDNGGGIPQEIKDKIFHPFFTTKPAGEGTGLGLSLCFDIIRMHGGEMSLETGEGEWTRFNLIIPYENS